MLASIPCFIFIFLTVAEKRPPSPIFYWIFLILYIFIEIAVCLKLSIRISLAEKDSLKQAWKDKVLRSQLFDEAGLDLISFVLFLITMFASINSNLPVEYIFYSTIDNLPVEYILYSANSMMYLDDLVYFATLLLGTTFLRHIVMFFVYCHRMKKVKAKEVSVEVD